MKNLFLSLATITLIGTSSCKKIDEIKERIFAPIDINLPEFQVAIPAILFVPPNEMSLGSFTSSFNLDSTVKANTGGAFGASAVSTMKVKQMTVTVSNPDQLNNLSNFESARFTFSSNTNTTPAELASFSFPDVYAATNTAVPANSPELKGSLMCQPITLFKLNNPNLPKWRVR